jgi:hypothetical protein
VTRCIPLAAQKTLTIPPWIQMNPTSLIPSGKLT